ncbi:hypothetical protein PIB30_066428 [Stylosanthes scabra]|uniref:Proteasome assembly chaperone 3 n=1 Tax=Stylosanthes scabra TaxID=79078 RepID=A0ABU6VLB3_9FABA|nr:hypothetical protein [Stylosanthes scabra]
MLEHSFHVIGEHTRYWQFGAPLILAKANPVVHTVTVDTVSAIANIFLSILQVDEKAEFPRESSSAISDSEPSLLPMNSNSNTLPSPQFPVRQNHFSVLIKGNKTQIIVMSYEDHFQVIATQIGTMGTILYARKEEGVSINPTFSVSVVFGKRDEPMLVACARQLIEKISLSGSSKPLVLSLGLKDHSTETLKGIISAVIDNGLW